MTKKDVYAITAIVVSLGFAFGVTAVLAHHGSPNEGLVVVHWYDITTVANWNEEEEAYAAEFFTVGWLVEEDSTKVVIASTWDPLDQEWREITTFPRMSGLEVLRP